MPGSELDEGRIPEGTCMAGKPRRGFIAKAQSPRVTLHYGGVGSAGALPGSGNLSAGGGLGGKSTEWGRNHR